MHPAFTCVRLRAAKQRWTITCIIQYVMWRNCMYYNNFHKQITIVLSVFFPLCFVFLCIVSHFNVAYISAMHLSLGQQEFSFSKHCLDSLPLIGELKQWTKQCEVICNEQGLFLAVTVQPVSMHWWVQFDWHIVVTGWGIFLLLAHWNVRVNSSGVNCSLL